MSIILGLDIGTSKICALAFETSTRETVGVRSAVNDSDITGLPSGRHEQDPHRIIALCLEVLRDLIADAAVNPEAISGIGISGQMHGVLLADAQGNPVSNLITWRDQRAFDQSQPENLAQHNPLDDKVASRTGCSLHPGYGGATLWWLGQNGGFTPGAKALTIADATAAALTGKVATEPTHAASWGVYNLEKMQWDQDAIKSLGLPESLFAEVLPSVRPISALLPEIANSLGVDKEIQVCSPVGDNQASVIGATGIPDLCNKDNSSGMDSVDSMDTSVRTPTHDGVGVVNLGTGGQVSVPHKDYIFIQNMETRPMPFGGYIQVGASICGGWSYSYLRSFYQQVAKEIGRIEITDAEAYARMNKLAASATPGANGLMADTRFLGTRGDTGIRGKITNIDAVNLTPANLTRAVIEGMISELAGLASAGGTESINRIVASGNAVRKNPLVKQSIEQFFNLPCEIGEAEEEAALGAALSAGAGLGFLK